MGRDDGLRRADGDVNTWVKLDLRFVVGLFSSFIAMVFLVDAETGYEGFLHCWDRLVWSSLLALDRGFAAENNG